MAFNLRKYWEGRYKSGGNSGAGSYGEESEFKATYINRWIKNTGAKSIIEIGCGDGNNLKLYEGFESYCGYDISPAAVELCKRIHPYEFTNDAAKIKRDADICLCLDVLFHQVEDSDYFEVLEMMFDILNPKYIILYSTSHKNNERKTKARRNGIATHMRNRDYMTDIEKRYPEWKIKESLPGYDSKIFTTYKRYGT